MCLLILLYNCAVLQDQERAWLCEILIQNRPGSKFVWPILMKDNGGERSIDWWPRFENWGSFCLKATVYCASDRVRVRFVYYFEARRCRLETWWILIKCNTTSRQAYRFYFIIRSRIKKLGAQFNPVWTVYTCSHFGETRHI